MNDSDPPDRDEFQLIELIRRAAGAAGPEVRLGIGDDAAALDVGGRLLVSVDVMNAGVHLPIDLLEPEQMGARAVLAAASDIAAMGGRPRWVLVGLAVPQQMGARAVERIGLGLVRGCKMSGCALIGGDLTRGALSISVTVLGVAPPAGAIPRSGARPGDVIYVGGSLGDSCLGFKLLSNELSLDDPAEAARLKARFSEPLPQFELGALLGERGLATALIDVSDGLAQDLGHVAQASNVLIELDVDALPRSAALARLPDEAARMQALLAWGEDYRLAWCARPERAAELERRAAGLGEPLAAIGRALEPDAQGPRVVLRRGDGGELGLARRGYRHF